MLSLNSEIYPMTSSVKVSLIAAVVATIGISGIATVSASPRTSSVAVVPEKIASSTNLARQPVEVAAENEPNNLSAYTGEELARQAKISLAEARQIALKAHPGKITDQELERESGGSRLRYSFDIKQGKTTYEVGVDAKTGKVLENAAEGKNPD